VGSWQGVIIFNMLLIRPKYRFCGGLIVALFLAINTGLFCQVDSLLLAPFKEKKSFTYGLNNRGTFLLSERGTIYGIYMGIQYGERMKHVITVNSNGFWIGQGDQVRLIYAGIAEEFTFLVVKRFEFISYIHGGIGFANYRKVIVPGRYETDRELVSPFEFGIHASYQMLDWLELKGGGGYRVVLLNELNELNGVYYKVGASIKLKELRSKIDARSRRNQS
jgi:hypothetical protein